MLSCVLFDDAVLLAAEDAVPKGEHGQPDRVPYIQKHTVVQRDRWRVSQKSVQRDTKVSRYLCSVKRARFLSAFD